MGVTDPAPASDPGTDLGEPVPEPVTWLDGNRAQQRDAAKGYIRKRRVYVLDFDDPELAGLEVKARSVSIGRFLALVKCAASIDKDAGLDATPEVVDAIDGLINGFTEALVSWTLLDEDGDPVPVTRDSVHAQDTEFILQLIDGWMTAIGGASGPLGQTSTGGVPSQVGSIPMVEPSPDL